MFIKPQPFIVKLKTAEQTRIFRISDTSSIGAMVRVHAHAGSQPEEFVTTVAPEAKYVLFHADVGNAVNL